jgi:polysaccharide deacetylase 2 family uncharacterized protein YibQ
MAWWIGYPLSFLIGILIALVGYALFPREKPPAREGFERQIVIADRAVRSGLFDLGLTRNALQPQPSSVRSEGPLQWTPTVLKVLLPRSIPLASAEETLGKSLAALGKSYSFKASRDRDTLRVEVAASGRLTHELTFVYVEPGPPPPQAAAPPPPAPSPPAVPPPAAGPPAASRVAIVIDDLGEKSRTGRDFLESGLPFTFSILPFQERSRAFAVEAHKRGRELILHVPMEPREYPKVKPGKGALLAAMDAKALGRQLARDLDAVPYVRGVSNHMGSRLTEDPEKMKVVLSELKRRNLFFLDSRTTARSVAAETARTLGLKVLERTVFLDHSRKEADIRKELERLVQASLANGKAIGIGHPRPTTFKVLKEMLPTLKERGVDIVPLSALLN